MRRAVLMAVVAGCIAAAPASRLVYGTYLPLAWSSNAVWTTGSDGSDYFAAVSPTYYSGYETIVAKLSPDGRQQAFRVTLPPSLPAAMAVDHSGNVIVAGTAGLDFPTTPGVFLPDSGTGFIVKLDPDGRLLWASRILADPRAVAVDASGAIYLTGIAGPDFQATSGALKPQIGPSHCRADRYGISILPCTDAFAAKISPDGAQLVYATFLGGTDNDYGYAIAVDSAGSAYVAGETYSEDFPVTPNAHQSKFGGAQGFTSGVDYLPLGGDGFFARIDPSAAHIEYATYLGGTNVDFAVSVAVDAGQNAYVAGTTRSSDFPVTPNAFQREYAGDPNPIPQRSGDAFLARFDAEGRASFVTYRGTAGEDLGRSVSVVTPERIYLGWTTNGPASTCSAPSRIDALDPTAPAIAASQPVFGSNITAAADAGGIVHAIGGSLLNTPFAITQDALSGYGPVYAGRFDFSREELFAPWCLVNAASYAATRRYTGAALSAAPGEMISIFGSGLAPGGRVRLGGVELPILYASDTQINASVPPTFPAGDSIVTIERGDFSASYPIEVWQVFPGIFTLGGMQGAVVNQDGAVNSEEHPARIGEVVAIYATGLGPLDENGQVASRFQLYINAANPTNATGMPVLYAGQAPGFPPGLYQVNARIPKDAATGYPLIRFAFDAPWFELSQDNVRIWVAPAE
jgi:uncharacterized protein (TIGR03437 family)